MTEMTEQRLAEIEARANAATKGNWQQSHRRTPSDQFSTQVYVDDGEPVASIHWRPMPPDENGVIRTEREANAAFIAAARTDVPDLVAEVRRLRSEIAAMKASYCPTMADMQAQTDALLNDPVAMDAFMATNPLPSEPPADLVEQVADVIRDNMMGDGFISSPICIADAIYALLQPRLEAADGLLQASGKARLALAGYVDQESAAIALDVAIATAKAAGIGGEK